MNNIKNRVVLFIIVGVAVVLTAAIICISVIPSEGDRFTEFYMLSKDGKASDYPSEISAGQPVSVKLGIINREGADANYRIQAIANGAIINTIETGIVPNSQKWERSVDIDSGSTAGNQTIKFFLYMNDGITPHLQNPLVLHIKIIGSK